MKLGNKSIDCIMNYNYIKYQNDIDVRINHKYLGRNDDIRKIPQFLIF